MIDFPPADAFPCTATIEGLNDDGSWEPLLESTVYNRGQCQDLNALGESQGYDTVKMSFTPGVDMDADYMGIEPTEMELMDNR